MNSRQRMLAALRRQDVDHVPCCCFFSGSLAGPQYTWHERADSFDRIVNELGLDSYVRVSIDVSSHPDVSTRVWTEQRPEFDEPILNKQIDTPLGPLTATIRMTDDLPLRDDIRLVSDWNVSRYVKPWLETAEDVERFRYVYLPPTDEKIAHAKQDFTERKQLADEFSVITLGECGQGLTAAITLFGAEQAVLISMDQPEIIERYLQIEHEVTMRQATVLADWGVDVFRRNGFYETAAFWNPRQIEELLVPLLKQEIDVMHYGGAAVAYTVCTGVMPMLDILADLDFDAYHCIEPALGQQDMAIVAQKLCDRHAIWGGVSGPIHIGEGTEGTARQAVRDAFAWFGPRGLVLSAVPSLRAHWPWQNALSMFDEWKKFR